VTEQRKSLTLWTEGPRLPDNTLVDVLHLNPLSVPRTSAVFGRKLIIITDVPFGSQIFEGCIMEGHSSTVGVFLLAENRLLLDVFARLLSRKNDIHVLGAAAIGPRVLLQVMAANPDVVLCDSLATALSADSLLLEIKRNLPSARVLLFGMDPDPEKFLIAVQHGAAGYVLKDASAVDVCNAIRAVAQGEAVCPSSLCRFLFDHLANSATWQPGVQVRKNLGLTRREQQIVQLVSEGLTNKEIAARLFLSEQTVKNHLRHMLRKAGASDRLEAIERWRAQGFWN
jgi:two-component system response regulator DevR